MTKQQLAGWVASEIEIVATGTRNKGRRIKDLELGLEIEHAGCSHHDLTEAIDHGIASGLLVAVRIKYGLNYNRRKRVVVAADAVSFVGDADVMVYRACDIPNTIVPYLKKSANLTLRTIGA